MVPVMYGDSGKAFFADQTPYLFPLMTDDIPYASLWTIVFKDYSEDPVAPWEWYSGVFMIAQPFLITSGVNEWKVKYRVIHPVPPPEVSSPFGDIYCELDEDLGEPACVFIASGLNPLDKPEFRISIGNFTDSRFFGETEGGDIVQGFRLQYD